MTDTTQDDLVKRLKIMARDIEMCEKLAWGSDSALMCEAADRIEELEAKLAEQDDLVQAAKRLAEYLNGDHIYMERVHYLAAAIRKGGE